LVGGTTFGWFLFEWRVTASTTGQASIGPVSQFVIPVSGLPLTGSGLQNLSGAYIAERGPGAGIHVHNFGPDPVFVPAGAQVVLTVTRLAEGF
jgi:hypothetical protein